MGITVLRVALVCALGLLLSGPAVAASESVEAFRAFFSRVESLQGQFRQETRDAQGEVLESSSGTMAIQRPERFRWVYVEPFRQIIVADGGDLWVYDVALEQVSVRPMEDMLAAGPAVLLSGRLQALERDFRIGDGKQPGWIRLEAKGDGWQFDTVRVHMSDGLPDRLELTDSLGQTTVLVLSELAVNPYPAAALFRFQPPEGIDVIGRSSAGSE